MHTPGVVNYAAADAYQQLAGKVGLDPTSPPPNLEAVLDEASSDHPHLVAAIKLALQTEGLEKLRGAVRHTCIESRTWDDSSRLNALSGRRTVRPGSLPPCPQVVDESLKTVAKAFREVNERLARYPGGYPRMLQDVIAETKAVATRHGLSVEDTVSLCQRVNASLDRSWLGRTGDELLLRWWAGHLTIAPVFPELPDHARGRR